MANSGIRTPVHPGDNRGDRDIAHAPFAERGQQVRRFSASRNNMRRSCGENGRSVDVGSYVPESSGVAGRWACDGNGRRRESLSRACRASAFGRKGSHQSGLPRRLRAACQVLRRNGAQRRVAASRRGRARARLTRASRDQPRQPITKARVPNEQHRPPRAKLLPASPALRHPHSR